MLIQLNEPIQNHTQNSNETLTAISIAEVQLSIPNAYNSLLMKDYLSPDRVGPYLRPDPLWQDHN